MKTNIEILIQKCTTDSFSENKLFGVTNIKSSDLFFFMDEFDFDEDNERKIMIVFNKEQDVYTIIMKNNLKSKNRIYFGYPKNIILQNNKNYSESKNLYKNRFITQYNEQLSILTNANNDEFHFFDKKDLYALKLLKYYTKKQIRNFDREKNVLDLFLDDERIIKYIEVIPVHLYTKKYILVSMYFYQNIDLLFYLWRPSFSFDEHFICIIAFKALKILELLKSRGVVHNDIKFENFIVSSEYPFDILLTDFESADMVNDQNETTLIGGTSIFKSPEVLRGESHDYETEIWSLGVCLFYHLCYEYPYEIKNEENDLSFEPLILEKINLNEIKRKKDNSLSDNAWGCLIAMLEKDPSRRITVEDALQLSWFQIFNDN